MNKLTDDEIRENNKEEIKKLEKFKEENKHPHCVVCESFDESFNMKIIQIINDEILIQSRLPKDTEIGNIITNEKYNSDEFIMGMAIIHCPFCSEYLNFGITFDGMIETIKKEIENIK